MNMTRAMSGQPIENPEDQANAEEGREAGTIEGGLTIASAPIGAALEMAAAPRVISRMVQTPGAKVAMQEGTGLVDKYGTPIMKTVLKEGEPIMKEIREEGASLLRQGTAKVTEMALKHKVTSGLIGLGVLKALGIHPAEILKELIP